MSKRSPGDGTSEGGGEPGAEDVIRFPQSRVRPPAGSEGFTDLGLSHLARQIGLSPREAHGHWCSRCHGIWWGYLLDCECPVCGGRSG